MKLIVEIMEIVYSMQSVRLWYPPRRVIGLEEFVLKLQGKSTESGLDIRHVRRK